MRTHTPSKQQNPMTGNARPRSIKLNLINEALARARMRRPQDNRAEAPRSARRIAMEARRAQARDLNGFSPFRVH